MARNEVIEALGYAADDPAGQKTMYRRLSDIRLHNFIDTAHEKKHGNAITGITLTEAGLRALGRIPEEPAAPVETLPEPTDSSTPSTDTSQSSATLKATTEHHFTVWARFEVPASLKERIGMQVFVDPPGGVPPMK